MSIRMAFILLTAIASLVSGCLIAVVILVFGHVSLTAVLLVRLVAVMVVVLLLSLGIGYTFAQPIRRRLYELAEAAVLLASGRLQHRVVVMGNGDEIDELGHQFNEMGAKLQEQVRILQELAAENKRLAAESQRGAVLDERQRLARELHDSVSQQLFALTMLSATAQRYFENESAKLGDTLEQMNDLANAAQREMRALLLHLRPVELDGRSLSDACEAFLNAINERHGLAVHFEYTLEGELPSVIEQQLFRVLQEAAANVLKHAQATTIQVAISGENKRVEMTVLDDGVGIDEVGHEEGHSYGLKSMRERAAALGGTFDVWRRLKGTAVRVSIPRVQQGKIPHEEDEGAKRE